MPGRDRVQLPAVVEIASHREAISVKAARATNQLAPRAMGVGATRGRDEGDAVFEDMASFAIVFLRVFSVGLDRVFDASATQGQSTRFET